jgi:hypothetical protein
MIECGVLTCADIVLGPSTAVCLDEWGQASEDAVLSSVPTVIELLYFFLGPFFSWCFEWLLLTVSSWRWVSVE